MAEVPALASLTEGATVTLFTSLGPPIVLPNVLNDRVSVAVAKLERAGLVPVVEQISRPFPFAPVVVAEIPAAGSSLFAGTRVVLRVLRSEPTCPSDVGNPSQTLTITIARSTQRFTRNCYYAAAVKPLTIRFTTMS